MAKPDWPSKRRDGDGDRGRNRDRNTREPLRDNVILHPASNRDSSGPRQDRSKPQVVKQGVKGALRAANLRLLLENAPVREALALVAEVPLERLEAMSQGALCPDETAFHIERALKLPGKWLDGLNKEVPERTLELLKNPDRAGLHDDEDFEEGAPALAPEVSAASAQPAAEASAVAQPAPTPTQAAAHAPAAQQAQGADVAASAAVEPAPGAASTEGAETAPAAGPAVDAAQALAAPDGLRAAGKRAAKATRRAAAVAEAQLPLTEIAPPSQSGPNETSSMASPELRKQNLAVLLQGKGAKSALARVLHAKPPYVSAMLSGRKSLDKELCHGMARALGLPADWFEAPHTAVDIPAATLQRLASLRDTAANADTTVDGDAGEVAAAPTAASSPSATGSADEAESSERSTARAAPAEQTRQRAHRASQHDHQQLIEPADPVEESTNAPATAAVAADLPAPVEPEVRPAVQEPAPVMRTEVIVPPAPASVAAPIQALAPATVHQATLQAADFTPVYSQPLIIEGGLAPITEALIKMLVLKARHGVLSEDKAFDLLGAVRLL
ncbi:hypothetical protein [Azohydromonas australica]|uniref:hypothetical protein n=1 Tax=Azohydromonas australica TaxID=364039 RepID=UPI00041352D7|nr:hypothetical protein [Azohydromonas australica]